MQSGEESVCAVTTLFHIARLFANAQSDGLYLELVVFINADVFEGNVLCAVPEATPEDPAEFFGGSFDFH